MLKNCKSLKTLQLPSQIEEIGNEAFAGCESLTRLEFPEGIGCLSNGVVAGCTSLEEVIIPESVESIGNNAFMNCRALREIILPEQLIFIGEFAFDGCSSISSIVIPDNVKELPKNSLSNCASLEKLQLSGALEKMGYQAVAKNPRLSEIVVPQNMQLIEYKAFDGCTGLKSVRFPSVGLTVRPNVFDACTSLTDIWFNIDNPVELKFPAGVTPTLHVPYGYTSDWSNAYPDNEIKACGTITFPFGERYSTYYTSGEYTMPDGLTGCIVSGVDENGSELIITDAFAPGEVVPPCSALLIKGSETTMFDVQESTGPEADDAANMLRGTDDTRVFETIPNERYYRLSFNDDGQYGFFYGTSGGKAFENKAHDAYLAVPVKQASFFGYVLGEKDSINGIETTADFADREIYTIDGRRVYVGNPGQLSPGLYIIDRRKVAIRN